MLLVGTENQNQILALKVTNDLSRPSNAIPRTKPCNEKIGSNFKYFWHYLYFRSHILKGYTNLNFKYM